MATPLPKIPVVLDVHKDEQGNQWYTVKCPHCGVDLSAASGGRLFTTGQTIQTAIPHPLQYARCLPYLLPALQCPKVWPPGRPDPCPWHPVRLPPHPSQPLPSH